MGSFEDYYAGLQKSVSGGSTSQKDDSFSKYYENLKMDVGMIPDTRYEEGKKQAASFNKDEQIFNPAVQDPNKPFMLPTKNPTFQSPEQMPLMQQANQYDKGNPAWNGWLDNPIVHGAENALSWAQKPFETVSVGLADTSAAVNNLFGTEKHIGYDGKEYTTTPSQSRNFLADLKNIWSQTNEHTSSDAWAGESPNLGKIKGTDANWTDVVDFGAQSLSPTKFITGPLELASRGVNVARGADKIAFKKAIDEFILRTQAAPVDGDGVSTAYHTAARQGLVQEAPAAGTNIADELAATFNRGEKYKQSYQQAIDNQYTFLKQSMDNRGGVDQGGIIKDPTTGEVINRYGRISNNPPWYQDFFKENGKKPSDAELRALAEQHVKEGFNDVGGRIPPWKPDEFHNIDEEIKHINELLPHADAQTAASLQETVKTLEQSRGEYGRSLPEGVQAMQAPPDGIQAMRSTGQVRGQAPKQPQTLETAAAQENVQNYAGNHMPFRAATGQTDKTINRNQIVRNIRKNIGVTIDTGRLGKGMKNVLGIYKPAAEVIRSGMAEDIQTISHEVGHHLDKKFKLQDPQFKNELDQLMQFSGHNVAAYKPSQQLEEGIAEFVRLYLTDRASALQHAPAFSRHFVSVVPAKVLKGLENTTQDINTWINQGDYEQAKGLIDFEGTTEKAPINKDKLYTRLIDDLNPIKLAEKALKGAVGVGNASIYKMARLSRGVAERAKMAVTRGIYDAAGNKVSDGLRDIVKPLEDLGIKERDFSTYLAVMHAIDLKAMGKRVPFTDQQIAAVMGRLDTPEIRAVQKKIVEYNDHLMDILVDAQILDPMTVTAMRKKYPNYVPMMRYFDEDAAAGFKAGGFGAAKGFANITNPIKRMSEEGSYRTIINPIESMVKNTFLVMNAAAKNKVGLQLADLAKIDGAGSWVEKVPGGSSPHEHVVNVFEMGERQAYKIRDPELYNAMLSLDAESSNSLIKFLGGTAGLLRAGATLTPEFMIRNAMRDVVGAMVNSTKYGFTPVDFFKGMYHVLGKTKTLDQFLSSGGAMGTLMSLDRDVSREALQQVFRTSLRDKALNVVTSPKELAKIISGYTPIKATVNMLRKGAEISELSTKVGVFNKTLKETGSMEEAAYTAKDLMDFNRAGSSIRQANRAIAFMNASIQGTDKIARAFKDNPASFLTRAFTTLVLPAVAIHYWNENLPDYLKAKYDNIPQWQKDTFFVFNIPGTDQFARIPKPFEAGMLFATGTERLLNWSKDHDPEAWHNYGMTTLQSLAPPTLFTALTPLLEAITNYSFFRKAPIVPMGEQGLEKVDQFGPYTSEVSKNIGQAATAVGLGDTAAASPRIIDNTIQGYTAGLGQYAIDGIDKVLHGAGVGSDTPEPAKRWNEQPVIRSFTATTSGGGQIRQDFYDKWSDLSKAKASADRNEEPYTDPMYPSMRAAKSYIDNALKQYKLIQKDKNMNSEEKRLQLDKLDGIINTVAAQALGKGVGK